MVLVFSEGDAPLLQKAWPAERAMVCVCVRERKSQEMRKETVISSWTSDMKEEESRGGEGSVDLKCLSASGGQPRCFGSALP